MAKRDGREIALANEERVLKSLFKFGWLRTRDIAALHWMPKMKREGLGFEPVQVAVSPTARRMAQRTLRRLRQRHMVVWIQAPDGSTIFGLSEAGARRLVSLGIPAKSGKDLIRRVSLSHFHHRRIANEVAIGALLQGFRANTELEIAAGQWLGGKDGVAGKKPDVVVRDGRKNTWFWEIERSARNKAGYASLIEALLAMWPEDTRQAGPASLSDGHRLHQVVFLANAAFIERVCNDLLKAGWTGDMVNQRIASVKVLYVTEAKFIAYKDRAEVASPA
ncbi:MAG: replication-relaxation family protein [Thiobacillus sp.]|nr:replication-relaxation family protein [Thiobacillus sp.]